MQILMPIFYVHHFHLNKEERAPFDCEYPILFNLVLVSLDPQMHNMHNKTFNSPCFPFVSVYLGAFIEAVCFFHALEA